MKSCLPALTALALLGSSLCTIARDLPERKIVLPCSATNPPQLLDIDHAIKVSDYWAPRSVRLQMLALAREACANRPTAVLTFLPPQGDESFAAPIASK